MKDWLGGILEEWRIRSVIPCVRGRLLDLGCGLNHLVERYGNGVGADVYQWGNVDVLIDDAGHLPFDAESFDTVAVVAALNHIPNREEALREVCRVLKHDGQLVMTMIPPTISRVWHAARRPWDPDQSERGMKPGEVWGLSRRDVRYLLRQGGFDVHYESRFMCFVNTLTVARKHRQPTQQ
jgi:SAM-dependent methyltransferase